MIKAITKQYPDFNLSIPDNSYVIWSHSDVYREDVRNEALLTLAYAGNPLPTEQEIHDEIENYVAYNLECDKAILNVNEGTVLAISYNPHYNSWQAHILGDNLNDCLKQNGILDFYVDADGEFRGNSENTNFIYRALRKDVEIPDSVYEDINCAGGFISLDMIEQFTKPLGKEAAKPYGFEIGKVAAEKQAERQASANEQRRFTIDRSILPVRDNDCLIFSDLEALTDEMLQYADKYVADNYNETSEFSKEDRNNLIGNIIDSEMESKRTIVKNALNVPMGSNIFAIIEEGSNNKGYGYMNIGNNIQNSLDYLTDERSRQTIFVNKKGDLCCVEHFYNHDTMRSQSRNIIYRAVKPELTSEQLNEFTDLILNGNADDNILNQYSERLGDKVLAALDKQSEYKIAPAPEPMKAPQAQKPLDLTFGLEESDHLIYADDMAFSPSMWNDMKESLEGATGALITGHIIKMRLTVI